MFSDCSWHFSSARSLRHGGGSVGVGAAETNFDFFSHGMGGSKDKALLWADVCVLIPIIADPVCLFTLKQSGALKRKLQSQHGNPPVKRKRKLSINTFRKGPTEADRREEGSSAQKPAPKKQLTDKQNESQKSRPFIRTSSLFKNNPDIPEIHRYFTKMGGEKNPCNALKFTVLNSHPCLASCL